MNNIDLNETHSILLQIANEFHTICNKHEIPYYMLCGTMLGAIRHKGFIPWDDDMDFGVPRPYFKRLEGILNRELSESLKIVTIDNCKSSVYGFIKIQDIRTVMEDSYRDSTKGAIGINIDIFPLDCTNSHIHLFSRNNLVFFLNKVNAYVFMSDKARPLIKKLFARLLRVCLFPLKNNTISNFIDRHIITRTGEYYANYYGGWGKKEIVSKSFFGSPVLYDFENLSFFGVEDYDNYLKKIYGDYMCIPKENERHIHMINAYWK